VSDIPHQHDRTSSPALRVLAALLATLGATGVGAAEPELTEAKGLVGSAGIGPAVVPKYVGSRSSAIWPIPILSLTYDDTYYIEFARAGVHLFANAEKTMALGLAVEPRFGHTQGDGPRLIGMKTRRPSLEGGPSFNWENRIVDVNLAYFHDLTGASHGTSIRATLSKDVLTEGKLKLSVNAGIDRVNGRMVDYYFGVAASEATATRPAYVGHAGVDVNYGFNGSYELTKKNSIVFGANLTRLNHSAATSPIVERRNVRLGWIGYAWNF
jgi:MipA family protein